MEQNQNKDVFQINCESLLELGIDPQEAIEYLERKRALTLNPAHVMALHILKKPLVHS